MNKRHNVFFSTDVHGASSIWKKWLNAPTIYDVDILMLCGDLTGKVLIPIIDQADGTHKVFYSGKNLTVQTEHEIAVIEEKLANVGVYSIRCNLDKIEQLKSDQGEVEAIIKEKAKDRLIEWLELLTKKIDLNKVKVIVMPGNDDDYGIDPVIRFYSDKGVIWCLDNVIELGSLELISLAHVNPTPWDTAREANEKQIAEMINNLVKKLSNPRNAIFNFHAPPFNTRIDLAPQLDKNKKPVTSGGQICNTHAGSKSVRKAIENFQPLLGLHGHIHEAAGVDIIQDTICINPGSEHSEGILHGYVIRIFNNMVENYWRVEG